MTSKEKSKSVPTGIPIMDEYPKSCLWMVFSLILSFGMGCIFSFKGFFITFGILGLVLIVFHVFASLEIVKEGIGKKG